jgi:hypothetical protein
MANMSKNESAKRQNAHSSISVSNQVVCEDDACIGKSVGKHIGPTEKAVHEDNERKAPQSPRTSMSVGGKDACSDDACIGKR